MNRPWRNLRVWLVAAGIFQGCVTVHAPLEMDKDYPPAWGNLSTLGPECKALEGEYLNEGFVAAAEGATRNLALTSVLNIRSEARSVALRVRTRKVDQNGDAFITLGVVPDGNVADLHELEGCFCIKQSLACTQVSEEYWSLPNFGLGGSQKNVYLSLAQDGSLIAKLQNYHADLVLLMPIYGMKEPWARFTRARLAE